MTFQIIYSWLNLLSLFNYKITAIPLQSIALYNTKPTTQSTSTQGIDLTKEKLTHERSTDCIRVFIVYKFSWCIQVVTITKRLQGPKATGTWSVITAEQHHIKRNKKTKEKVKHHHKNK